MGLKSAIFLLVLGITLGFIARDYDKELQAAKGYLTSLVRKATVTFFKQNEHSSQKPHPDESKSAKDSKKGPKTSVQSQRDGDKNSEVSGAKERLFTKSELWELYRGGEGSKGLHIAIMGRVYDVAKGARHYGPGGGYDFFAGRDGTKAYSTGEFNDQGLTDDLTGVETSHFGEYDNWIQFFDKEYTYVGKLVGNFYDENGRPTEALHNAWKMMKKAAKIKKDAEAHNRKFPTCNSEWSQAKGSRVWCTNKSGGIDRDWVGVPRLLKQVGSETAYCVCIRNTGPPTLGHTNENSNRGDLDYPYLKEYEGCDPNSQSCKVIRKKS